MKLTRPLDSCAVMKAEICLYLNYVEHQLPFQVADHSEIYSLMFPGSKIARDFKCKRTKATYLINDAIGPCLRKELISYSLCIDESNDC